MITSHRKLVMHSSLELVLTVKWTSQGVPIALVIWGRSVCNEYGALYLYGEPQSASDIGTPGTPQIASVIGTGGLKIGGSPYHFYSGLQNKLATVFVLIEGPRGKR